MKMELSKQIVVSPMLMLTVGVSFTVKIYSITESQLNEDERISIWVPPAL